MFETTSRKREKCQKYGASSAMAVMFLGESATIRATSALLPAARRLTTLLPNEWPGAAYGCCSGSLVNPFTNRFASAAVNGVRLTTIVDRSPAVLSWADT